MEPIELVMKIFRIQDEYKDDVEDALKNCSPKYLGLSLANLAQHPDDEDYDPTIDEFQ